MKTPLVNGMLRPLALAVFPALLATSTVLFEPGPPTAVPAGDARSPVIAVAATAQWRAPASRTAVTVIVAAGSSPAENGSRVAAVRAAIGAAAPSARAFAHAFDDTALPGSLGPAPAGGHVWAVIPAGATTAVGIVANAIRPFWFARIRGAESEPADCAAAQAAADAHARAVARSLAAAGAAALGRTLGAISVSTDRTDLENPLDSSIFCRPDDPRVHYPLDRRAVPDDRSTLQASFAFAFRAVTNRSSPRPPDVAADVDSEPVPARRFPRAVELVVGQRAMTIVGTASAPVAYAGDLVTYSSATRDDALRARVRAFGVSDVRWYVAGDAQAVLAVRVPRGGAVTADDVVRVMRAAAGDRAREVGSAPYADCMRRDAELVTAAIRDAGRRAAMLSSALKVPFAAPVAVLITEPVSTDGCTPPDAAMHQAYTPGARWLSGAPDSTMRTVAVAITYPFEPLGAPDAAATVQPRAHDDTNRVPPDDLTPLAQPPRALEVATATAAQTLDAQRVEIEIDDAPDAAHAFRPVDPAAVELAVMPWLAGAVRTYVATVPRRFASEPDDIAVGFRLDRIPAAFTNPQRIADTLVQLGAFGNPTLEYTPFAEACRAAADAATVDAVRRTLAGGVQPNSIVVGGPVLRRGGCGSGAGLPAYAWSDQPVDTTVRIEVTARGFR